MAVSDFNCPGCSLPGLKANEINYGRVQADVRKSWAFRNVIDQAIFTHRVFVNLYIAGSSAAPNSGPSTKMVSSCVMTSWKKKTFEEQFVHPLPNSNAHKKCCWKTVLPASAHYKLHFHSIPSFINVCKMLRNNFKADRTIFRQLFSLQKHRTSWTVIFVCIVIGQGAHHCTSLGIHLVTEATFSVDICVGDDQVTTLPTPMQSWRCIETLANAGPAHDRPWQ